MNGILVMDLELTCWSKEELKAFDKKPSPEIIQVGVVNLNPKTLEVTKSGRYYVTPQFTEIGEYCTDLTAITAKQVHKQGRPLEDVMKTLAEKWGFSNKQIVFWGSDADDFAKDCKRQNIENILSPHITDFGLQYSLYHSMKTQEKYQQVGLVRAMGYENLEFKGRQHDGLVDAENTARLFQAFYNKIAS
jgi:inhibitor of KinA sporulation pathway (predicted exonuclease)